MTGRLQTSGIAAPGFLGLNSQDSEVTLESGYATTASNCIIDSYGRLGSRRGWTHLTTNSGTLGTAVIKSIFEFKNVDGVITYLSAGNNKLFTGTTTLTEKKIRNATDTADVAMVATADNWQWAGLASGSGYTGTAEAYVGQVGNPLLKYSEVSASFIFQRVGDVGAVPTGTTVDTFDPNCVMSAYGRVWAANLTNNKFTVFYSQLLMGDTFTGAGSGILDISAVVGNNDTIEALASHNGFLIVFCTNNIVVYANADDPTNITLSDVITGVGCIARDSVQKTGTDLIFLSRSGIRSLTRTIQEKSMPMRELSINVRDALVRDIQNEVLSTIKAVYFERDAFYLLSLPSTNTIYCFDLRTILPNGGAKVTTWGITYTAFCATQARELYLGVASGIATYTGYTDNTVSYRMIYYTANTDMGQPSTVKFLKKAKVIVIGNSTQDFVIKYGFDYNTQFSPRIFLGGTGNSSSEYNIAEYGIGEYSGGLAIASVNVNLGGSGKVIKFGIETEVNGAPISIQKADIYVKLGKLL
jgi:hypothetical protein